MSYIAVSHVQAFLAAAAAGVVSGVVFDVTRLARRVTPGGTKRAALVVWFEDAFCLLAAVALTFYAMLGANFAYIRPYNIAGAGLGAVLYFCTVSRLILGAADKMINVVKKLTAKAANAVGRVFEEAKERGRKRKERRQRGIEKL